MSVWTLPQELLLRGQPAIKMLKWFPNEYATSLRYIIFVIKCDGGKYLSTIYTVI